MITVLGSIVTPAIVASIFSLLVNTRASKRRDYRDAVSMRVKETRELVASATNAAASYFCLDAKGRTPQLEAALWMAEKDVRLALFGLAEKPQGVVESELSRLQSDFDIFVSELTGGNFQQTSAKADLAHIRKIASIAADLRSSISLVNEEDLRTILDNDPLSKVMRALQIKPYYRSLKDEA